MMPPFRIFSTLDNRRFQVYARFQLVILLQLSVTLEDTAITRTEGAHSFLSSAEQDLCLPLEHSRDADCERSEHDIFFFSYATRMSNVPSMSALLVANTIEHNGAVVWK